jgi:general secretion pathway protein D
MKRQKPRKFLVLTAALLIACTINLSDQHRWSIQDAYGQAKTTHRGKNFSLNFKDVEIAEFVMALSELVGKNIVLDDKVKGKITVTSARDIPVHQAYDILKSILEVRGFAVIETPNLVKIVPIGEAMKKNYDVIVDGKEERISPDKEQTVTYLLKVKYTDAAEIAGSLKELKSQNTQIVTHRTINTLIFSGMASEVSSLIKIARALDEGAFSKEPDKAPVKGNIHVVHLENANAEELASVLSRIPFSENMKIDTSPLPQTQTPQILPKSDKGKSLMKTQTFSAGDKQKLSIVANKETNSLIITAKPDEFMEIQRVIRELDIVREQVLIEALIVEVNAESGWSFGINWMLGQDAGGGNLVGGSSIQGTSLPNYSLPSWVDSTKKIAVPLATGLQLGYLADTSVLGFALLNASMNDTNIKILSTPQLLTIDNHEAELNVGQEIAVPTNTRITDTGNTFQTFDYKSVGIKLKITPHITKKQKITLNIYQEANDVLESSTTTSSGTVVPPTLSKRDIKTKISVLDGKTIVIGGLIRNNKTEKVYKTPFLGDIPLLGWLFKQKTVSNVKSNLLVFITPRIVTRQDKIDAITRKKINLQRVIRSKH